MFAKIICKSIYVSHVYSLYICICWTNSNLLYSICLTDKFVTCKICCTYLQLICYLLGISIHVYHTFTFTRQINMLCPLTMYIWWQIHVSHTCLYTFKLKCWVLFIEWNKIQKNKNPSKNLFSNFDLLYWWKIPSIHPWGSLSSTYAGKLMHSFYQPATSNIDIHQYENPLTTSPTTYIP